MKWFASLIAVGLACLLMIPLASAQDQKGDDQGLKEDLNKLQGKWERASTSTFDVGPLGKAKRVVKEHKGNKNTVTWYDDKDNIIRSHCTEFKLSRADKVKVFTFSNMEILEGPGKGQKVKASGSYIYRLDKDTLFEAGGLLEGEPFGRSQSYLVTWKRISDK